MLLVVGAQFFNRDLERLHFEIQSTKSLDSGNLKNHRHDLNNVIGFRNRQRVTETGVVNHNELHRNANLKERRSGVKSLDYSIQPVSRRYAKPKLFRYDSLKLTSKRLPREVPANHGKFVLEKDPEDIKTIFIIFIFMVSVGELLSSPAFNLANSEIVEFLGENSREFGKIPLWGPIGHMIVAPCTAPSVTYFHYVLCGEYQDNFAIAFAVIAFMAICAFVSVTQFQSEQATEHNKLHQEGEEMSLTTFFAQYQNFIFILMTFLIGCFDGVVLTFGYWYTETLDVSIATVVFGFSRMT